MIRKIKADVYYSPTANRRSFSKSAAIRREAIARIKKKHPTERPEFDDRGLCTYGGFHWSCIDRSDVLLRRYIRIIKAATP